ncbi:hypothetical protein NDS46_30105 (plasmid) [Paenibacillus thiaminolyticus]|uniref:hypothetical protein n=1 Tax=Paenibacillus thiaminolyticus TaxID=49283 RepID=UPI00232CA754|nr:hypothetical protein [Paenibacillus thiaminolyticus]WCF11601.1 hypothetical protein NDS46_30105 [Paenibacillus thiaminolyticus]
MDVGQIIELGKKIESPGFFFGVSIEVVFVATISLIFLLVTIASLVMREEILLIGMIFIMLVVSFGVFNIHGSNVEYNTEVEKWKNEFVAPYIKQLPVQKNEIIYIKIEAQLGTDVNGQRTLGSGYINSTNVERTPVTVSFKDGEEVITRTDWFQTSMELSDEEKPFIEYQRLEHDLGHGIEPGFYNVKIHLPKSYTFSEIK